MNIITIDGVIGWDVLSYEIARQLVAMKGKDIVVEMSTPGGMVSEGIAIYNRLKNHDGVVNVVLIGNTSSMGTYIAMAGDTVEAEDNVVFMIHNPRNFAGGDYRVMRKNADNLESLSSLLANKYIEKTGKPFDEMRELMDEETYYYGEEMVEAGFVDLIRPRAGSSSALNRSDAVAICRSEYEACMLSVKESEKSSNDIEQAAAMLTDQSNSSNEEKGGSRSENPAHADNQQEASIMDLKTAMAEHPAIKAEVDALAKEKYDAGISVGRGEMEKRVVATANYLGDTEYPKSVQVLALKVLKGDEPAATLTTVVTVLDAQKEEAASLAAQNEQGADTQGQHDHNTGNDDGMVASEDDYQAAIAQENGGDK